MLKYKKLPKGTPKWVTYIIFWFGGALGLSISAMVLLALYGFDGFLHLFFFPNSGFVIQPSEAVYLGIVGVSAALSAVFLSFLGVRMNQLSKRAIGLSRMTWAPLLITMAFVYGGALHVQFVYGISSVWVWVSAGATILGGVLPWFLLRRPEVAKVHKQ